MDEPMSGLDPVGRREVRDLMLSLRNQGKTIFFSSHILSDVEALCDRAAILTGGHLLRCGTVQEMTADEGSSLEIIAIGVDSDSLIRSASQAPMIESVAPTANGVRIAVKEEVAIDEAIRLIRRGGGRIVSVNPRRRSLELMFSDDSDANTK
jgi:ABC-2 type transport system ATP-binding protein